MDYQTAFDWMDEMLRYDCIVNPEDPITKTRVELELLCMQAIDKQIPKTVQLWEHPDYHARNYPCPNCGEMLGFNVNKRWTLYCPHCGESYYKELWSEGTLIAWAPVYKDGVLMNSNPNVTTIHCECLNCGERFDIKE